MSRTQFSPNSHMGEVFTYTSKVDTQIDQVLISLKLCLKSTYYKFISYKLSINIHSKTSDGAELKNNRYSYLLYIYNKFWRDTYKLKGDWID